jgi:DNA-binding transcriptional LysR family regulator
MDRLREMEVFLKVVEARSFSGAARSLNTGQPAVSKTIASLEDRPGVRLLTRSTRKLSPRQMKRRLRQRAPGRDWKAGYESLHRSRSRGLHLVPKLGSFLDAHPEVQLELVMDDRVVDLVAENIDAALRMGVLTESALKARLTNAKARAFIKWFEETGIHAR